MGVLLTEAARRRGCPVKAAAALWGCTVCLDIRYSKNKIHLVFARWILLFAIIASDKQCFCFFGCGEALLDQGTVFLVEFDADVVTVQFGGNL